MPVTDVLAAVRWWAVLAALGWAAFPLVFVLLRRLPDRGYGLIRMAGVLVTAYVFWLGGSLGFTANNGGGMLLGIAALLVLSVVAYRRRPAGDAGLGAWLREQRRVVIASEIVFAVVFALWVWVRAQNPAIAATEKPMEFAFLNAAGRSPAFPPLDPWLSGYAISYYYFGYVMTSLIARLALVQEPVAFNLAIAWLVAGTALGAFSLAYNLIAGRERGRGAALILGLVAAAAVPIAGNLQMGMEVLHGNGTGSAALWEWLDVRDINGPPIDTGAPRYLTSEWWWWRTSRVIHEYHLSGRSEEGLEPIVEVPAFSFVLGDLHPHVLALPFAFLSLGVALAWWSGGVGAGRASEGDEALTWRQRLNGLPEGVGWPLWGFTALVLGGLSFLNTWDVLIHLFVVLGAFFLALWYRQGHTRHLLGRTVAIGALLIGAAFVLYLPFYLGFRSQAGPPFILPMLMRPTRLAHYLIIFGVPLIPITAFLISLAARGRFRYWRQGLAAALALIGLLLLLVLLLTWILASTEPSGGMVGSILNELGRVLPPRPEGIIAPGWGLAALAALLGPYAGARLAWPWLTLALGALLALVVMSLAAGAEHTDEDEDAVRRRFAAPALPFVLLLILTAILLTLGPEFLYLRDNFGVRLNTTFKFYYQAWVMFGVAAVFAIDYLWSQAGTAPRRLVAAATTGAYLLLLAVALLFPFYAVQSRSIEYRGPPDAADRQPATLNGLAYLQRYNAAEYEAIMWLREQAAAAGASLPVVLEAVGGQYSGFGRVSASTGLPTILGWPGHEWQWRGSDHPEPGRREPIVQQIYTATDLGIVGFLLDQFEVAYIYVGDQEVNAYGPAGLEKFRDRLEVAFANDRVTIYRWQPAN